MGLSTPGGGTGTTIGHIGSSTTHGRAAALKDPRDSKPRQQRERMADDILAFCAAHQHAVSQKELLTPTGPQFESMFKFLVAKYDPALRLSPVASSSSSGASAAAGRDKNAGAKLADEVMQTLRAVQYPFADSITKSHLQAVGSAQSWPNMLAMLHWFVKVIEVRLSLLLLPLLPSPSHAQLPDSPPPLSPARRPASKPSPPTSSSTCPPPTLRRARART